MSDETRTEDEQATDGERPADGKMLSDDEVGALLEGMASGEVQICSSKGPQLAAVSRFNVPQRSRLASKRLPNLDRIAERFSERLRVHAQQILKRPVEVTPRDAGELAFEAIAERRIEPVVAVQFSAAPLEGHGALLLEPELVGQIVEGYFGGVARSPGSRRTEGFTYGELRVAGNFAALVLDTLRDLWQPLAAIEPVAVKTEQSVHLLDFAADADAVVRTSFDLSFAEQDTALHLLMPSAMIGASLPFLRGVDREEDAAKDRRWNDAIRLGMHDVDVSVAVTAGDVTMTLGELICLEPGDVIPIVNPRDATLRACGVPLMAGRFGVHAGRNAVEATAWLTGK